MAMKRVGRKKRKLISTADVDDKKPPWSDLPYEILELIKKRLFFVDQVNFRVVCKSWSCVERVQSLQQMPWLLVFHNEFNQMNSCKLVDSIHKKTYTIDVKAIKDKLKIRNFNPVQQRVHESKYGWLLMSYYRYRNDNPIRAIFLYNPFMEEKINFIDLPILSSSISLGITLATFTSNPLDNDDCTVLVLSTNYPDNTIHINTYRRGQSSWNSLIFKCEFSLQKVGSWMYSEGIFYYVTNDSIVGKFDFARETWNVFPSLPTAIGTIHDLKYHMVKSDGELFLILECDFNLSRYRGWCYFAHHIYKLDLSSMIWEDLSSIGDRVLFIGKGYNSVLNASVLKFNGERKDISDKIYYSLYYGLKYFTVHDYTLRNCDSGKPRKLDCSRHYGSIVKKEGSAMLFIDPPPR